MSRDKTLTGKFNNEMNEYFHAKIGAYTTVTEIELKKKTFNVKAVIRDMLIEELGGMEKLPTARSGEKQEIEFKICKKMKGIHSNRREIPCKFSKPNSNEMSIYFSTEIINEFNMKEGDVWYIYFKMDDATPWFGIIPESEFVALFTDFNRRKSIKKKNKKNNEIKQLKYDFDLKKMKIEETSPPQEKLSVATKVNSYVTNSTSVNDTGIKEMNKKIKGNMGEIIAVEIEKRRLKDLGREDLISKIIHIAEKKDGLGYDIISTNIDDRGKEEEIYIEVKTTSGPVNKPFQISANEVRVSEKYGKAYYIYRIYELKTSSEEVKYYKKCGCVKDNFKLANILYSASPCNTL